MRGMCENNRMIGWALNYVEEQIKHAKANAELEFFPTYE